MNNIWQKCKETLKNDLGEPSYSAYISALELDDNFTAIKAPSTFVARWVEKNLLENINQLLSESASKTIKLRVITNDGKTKAAKRAPIPESARPKPSSKQDAAEFGGQFKQQYSFDSFVVGKCNEFAHASAFQAATQPGKKYNPLFLYGGVGLGKTHLMQAIGNYILDKNNGTRVLYISSEQFVNQMISALQKGQMESFRKKFRSVDVLLVDDIQFIGGKDRTQEEFFHTFNALFEDGKQIVVSSDQFPKDIKKLEERLKSRFEWGLIADIQPAELETKIAIIEKKAESNGCHIPREVSEYLAETIRSNIRELEGCLARIVAYSSLANREINLELARETMRGVYSEARQHIDIPLLQQVVSAFYSIRISDLKSKGRAKKITLPRQVTMYFCREYTDESLPEIGKKFGGRDHSTVIHAHQKIKKEIEVNTQLYNEISAIKRELGV